MRKIPKPEELRTKQDLLNLCADMHHAQARIYLKSVDAETLKRLGVNQADVKSIVRDLAARKRKETIKAREINRLKKQLSEAGRPLQAAMTALEEKSAEMHRLVSDCRTNRQDILETIQGLKNLPSLGLKLSRNLGELALLINEAREMLEIITKAARLDVQAVGNGIAELALQAESMSAIEKDLRSLGNEISALEAEETKIKNKLSAKEMPDG